MLGPQAGFSGLRLLSAGLRLLSKKRSPDKWSKNYRKSDFPRSYERKRPLCAESLVFALRRGPVAAKVTGLMRPDGACRLPVPSPENAEGFATAEKAVVC